MLTLLTLRMSATFACRDSWTLSASCPLVPALFVLLSARFLPAMSFWLGLLLLMRPCLLVNVCLLLAWCAVACALSLPPSSRVARRCPPFFCSFGGAKPSWGRAWSPIYLLFLGHLRVGHRSRTTIGEHNARFHPKKGAVPCDSQMPEH
jgi:hypothetical protein